MVNNFRNESEPFTKASEQKDAGEKDLANFFLSLSPNLLQDPIATPLKRQEAEVTMHRKSIKCMDLHHQHVYEECVDGCNGMLLRYATEVFNKEFC